MISIIITPGDREGEDESSLTPVQRLLMEIVRRCGREVDQANLVEIAGELTNVCGSAERALEMVQAGQVEFVPEDKQ